MTFRYYVYKYESHVTLLFTMLAKKIYKYEFKKIIIMRIINKQHNVNVLKDVILNWSKVFPVYLHCSEGFEILKTYLNKSIGERAAKYPDITTKCSLGMSVASPYFRSATLWQEFSLWALRRTIPASAAG